MLALSIRQPFAELILRGIKTVEYRTRPTRIIGERFWIYASKGRGAWGKGQGKNKIWSNDLHVDTPAGWMIELAEQVGMIEQGALLPTGVIVGSGRIARCEEIARDLEPSMYAWHLQDIERVTDFRKPDNHPQPVWFKPF